MASEFDEQVKDLANKYGVPTGTVNNILVDYIVELNDPYALQKLDWKDLDVVVQEGLAEEDLLRRQGRR